jgi:hypothetical protein
MDVQAAPPPFAAGNASKPLMGNPPVLGAQVPGTTGGLPALSGLAATQNPMARELQSYGRGDDSMLVHMTPEEVNSLQGLAMATGGSLTINPHTGLPEAGWLGKLLPTILGAVGMAFGIPPIWMGAAGAVGGTIATGDLGKGLSMGLQAYGGAALGGAAGIGGKLGSVGQSLGLSGSQAIGGAAGAVKDAGSLLGGNSTPFGGLFTEGASTAAKAPGFFGKFGQAAQAGLPGGIIGKAAPMLAASGVMSGLSAASQPNLPKYKPEEPGLQYREMEPLKREVRFQTPEQMEASGGAEFPYFTPTNPEPVPVSQSVAQPMAIAEDPRRRRFAEGGTASSDAPPGFNELVAAYSASNPGAITASMKYPVSTPVPNEEQLYNLNPQPITPIAPIGGGTGGGGLGGLDLSNFDFSAITDYLNTLPQGTPLPSYSDPGYDMPIVDTPIMDTPGFDPPRGMDYFGGGYAGGDFSSPIYSQPIFPETSYDLPTQQPIYSEPVYDQPVYSAPVYEQPSYSAPVYEQPSYDMPIVDAPIMDMSGFDMSRGMDFFGGNYFEPTPQLIYSEPVYEQPNYMYPYYGESSPTTPTYFEPPQTDFFGSMEDVEPGFDSGPLMYDFNNEGAMGYGMFAKGGGVAMRDGAFVVDARTVSELGNGSSNAGIEMLSRMGGRPVRGPGDGVSDSVPAKIGGKQKARVARDEVIFQPDAVRRIGKGSAKRGTAKLYALMEKAHKARKKAKRGQDTKVRRGLG